LLGGCAATYKAPADAATGLVVVKRGESDAGSTHTVHYRLYTDGGCENTLGSLGSIGWLSPDPKESQVAAGTRVFLRSFSTGQQGMLNYNCVTVVSFVPQAHARYEFTTDKTGGGCRIKAVSQLAPLQFQSHPVTGRCR
jgi:hypothetical protein